MKIDIHTHFIGAATIEFIKKNSNKLGSEIRLKKDREYYIAINGRDYGQITPLLWDNRQRFASIDDRKLDVEVLSLPPFMFYYDAEKAAAAEFARVFNDTLSQVILASRGKTAGLMTVPLQDVKLAVKEVERAAKLPGIKGVMVGTVVNDRELNDPAIIPFWEAVESLGLPIMIHPPVDIRDINRRGNELGPIIGAPLETTVAVAGLLYSRLLTRIHGLKLILVHGGGSVPWIWDRFNYLFNLDKNELETMNMEVFKNNLYFDSITHCPES